MIDIVINPDDIEPFTKKAIKIPKPDKDKLNVVKLMNKCVINAGCIPFHAKDLNAKSIADALGKSFKETMVIDPEEIGEIL